MRTRVSLRTGWPICAHIRRTWRFRPSRKGPRTVDAGAGAFIVHAIWTQLGRDPHPVVVILFAIAGAAAAMVLQRSVIVIATAFGGAWTLIVVRSRWGQRSRAQGRCRG